MLSPLLKTALLIPAFTALSACGTANFSGQSQAATAVTVPVLATGTDYYAEIGQQFSNEISGGITLSSIEILAQATWSGANALQFELRIALQGVAGNNATNITGLTPPSGWANGTGVFNQNLTGSSKVNNLTSANLVSLLNSLQAQSNFWIDIRVRSSGVDLSQNLVINSVQASAQGSKSLGALSPLLNLLY